MQLAMAVMTQIGALVYLVFLDFQVVVSKIIFLQPEVRLI